MVGIVLSHLAHSCLSTSCRHIIPLKRATLVSNLLPFHQSVHPALRCHWHVMPGLIISLWGVYHVYRVLSTNIVKSSTNILKSMGRGPSIRVRIVWLWFALIFWYSSARHVSLSTEDETQADWKDIILDLCVWHQLIQANFSHDSSPAQVRTHRLCMFNEAANASRANSFCMILIINLAMEGSLVL